jgi:hypothetical protein
MAVEERELEKYRLALQRQIKLTTLRGTARDVGLSASGLHNLAFNGSRPYTATWHRLRAWYVRHNTAEADTSPETALAAVQVLLAGVPPAARAEAEVTLTEVLKQVHRKQGGRPPRWLKDLAKRLKAGSKS